ncbi:hypothetical protein [Brevibacterium casei]|nr:hypothetical protein [Brevibacterium casei]
MSKTYTAGGNAQSVATIACLLSTSVIIESGAVAEPSAVSA